MKEYPKKIRTELQRLAGTAYDRDMEKALTELETHFRRWRSGEISPFDLNNLIHAHHDGISRDLWKFYHHHPESTVPRAIANGTLKEDEIPEEIMDYLAETVSYFRKEESHDIQS